MGALYAWRGGYGRGCTTTPDRPWHCPWTQHAALAWPVDGTTAWLCMDVRISVRAVLYIFLQAVLLYILRTLFIPYVHVLCRPMGAHGFPSGTHYDHLRQRGGARSPLTFRPPSFSSSIGALRTVSEVVVGGDGKVAPEELRIEV